MDAVLSADPAPTAERGEVLTGAVSLAVRRGIAEGRLDYSAENVEIARALADPGILSRRIAERGANEWMLGHYRAADASLAEALALAQRAGADGPRADALHLQGILASARSRYEEARALLTEAVEVLRAAPEGPPHMLCVLHRPCALQPSSPGWPRIFFEDTIMDGRLVGSAAGAGYALLNLGSMERSAGEHDAARAALLEGLRTFRSLGARLRRLAGAQPAGQPCPHPRRVRGGARVAPGVPGAPPRPRRPPGP